MRIARSAPHTNTSTRTVVVYRLVYSAAVSTIYFLGARLHVLRFLWTSTGSPQGRPQQDGCSSENDRMICTLSNECVLLFTNQLEVQGTLAVLAMGGCAAIGRWSDTHPSNGVAKAQAIAVLDMQLL